MLYMMHRPYMVHALRARRALHVLHAVSAIHALHVFRVVFHSLFCSLIWSLLFVVDASERGRRI